MGDYLKIKTDDGYEVLYSSYPVEIPIKTGIYQSKSATPSASQQIVSPDTGYDALSSVTVSGDANLISENIKKDITIFGVTGTHQGGGTYQTKTVTPTSSGFDVNPDSGYDALSKVTVSGDENLISENVKEDVTIFGVTGTHKGQGTYQSKTVTPTSSGFDVNPDSGYDALSKVTVNGDLYLTANNVKKDITIFGVTGTYEGEPIAGSGGMSYSEESNSYGTSVIITKTSGGYGMSYTTSVLEGGIVVDLDRTGSEIGRNMGSLIISTLQTSINRVVVFYGDNTVTALIVDHVSYVNIPYPYTGTVKLIGYYNTNKITSAEVTISEINKYTCSLEA